MSSINISDKLDLHFIEFYERVTNVTSALQMDFFVVGATARDHIFEAIYDIQPDRATRDIDLAVGVESWEEFEQLKAALIDTGNFSHTKSPHKLKYANYLRYIKNFNLGISSICLW